MVLLDNFTIAFWAKARRLLDIVETANTTGVKRLPVGSLFFPFFPVGFTSGRGFGVHLGVDGFSVVWHGINTVASIVVERLPLIGWHHYSIVYSKGEPFVYLDGDDRDSSQLFKVINRTVRVTFRPVFARTRYRWLDPSNKGKIVWGSGFEGRISELRLANRSMHGGEALAQIQNQSAWDFSYSINGCSGENHTGTEIDRFQLQQAWLVCKEALPTCGSITNAFEEGEPAGCLCESEDGSRRCVEGEWSASNASVNVCPLTRWRLDQNSTIAFDSSGNGFNGQFIGITGKDYVVTNESGLVFTSFRGASYIDFGDLNGFQFGTRDFAIEAIFRVGTARRVNPILTKRKDCSAAALQIWVHNDGLLHFLFIDNAGGRSDLNSSSIANDSQWHTFRAVRRGNESELFFDGFCEEQLLTMCWICEIMQTS